MHAQIATATELASPPAETSDSNNLRILDLSRGESLASGSYLSCEELRQLRLFASLSTEGLQAISQSLDLVHFNAGHSICTQNDPGNHMFVVVRGRVKVSCLSDEGERVLRFLDRDEHFGEMSVLTGNRRTANVTAVTNTLLISIDRSVFDDLRNSEPTFAAMISETLAVRLASSGRGPASHSINRNIGILFGSASAERLSQSFADEMIAMGATVKTVRTSKRTGYRYGKGSEQGKAECALPTLAELHPLGEQFDRVLVSISYDAAEHHIELITRCDHILCFIEKERTQATLQTIEQLLADHPNLASRIHCVHLSPEGDRFAELDRQSIASRGRDFKLPFSTGKSVGGEDATRRALRRIIRALFDQRIGLALGGGGARGLAHLGVLRAFEEEGIGIDLLSGTSMGALVGLSYAAGWRPSDAETLFREELTPGRFFRMLPRGNAWFMLMKFRLRRWEPMLRKYFENATFKQLQIPLCSVSADLLRGDQIIRETGDCVSAILESINLPYISRPIMHGGCVLVDGGVLNNVPIDLLQLRGARTVIGVDVCSHLPHGFGRKSKNEYATPRRPSLLETALRLNEIRSYHVRRANHSDADQMIWIDTSRFEFEDFSNAHQLANVGYEAAREVLPKVKQLVDDRFAQSLNVG